MTLMRHMEITISTDSMTSNEPINNVDSDGLRALQSAVAGLAAEGRSADFIMQSVLQACFEQLPEFRQQLEHLEHGRMLERLDHLRKRGLLALA
jgi:hypothetical protein